MSSTFADFADETTDFNSHNCVVCDAKYMEMHMANCNGCGDWYCVSCTEDPEYWSPVNEAHCCISCAEDFD